MNDEKKSADWELGASTVNTDDCVSDPAVGEPPRSRGFLFGAVFLGALLAGGAALFLWQSLKEFPSITSGIYLGSIKGVTGAEEEIPLFVERVEGMATIKVAVLSDEWSVMQVPSGDQGLRLGVLLTSSGGHAVRLFGKPLPNGGYGGEADEVSQGGHGSWEVKPVKPLIENVDETPEHGTARWLSLKGELAAATEGLVVIEKNQIAAEAELRRLSTLLEDQVSLRQDVAIQTESLVKSTAIQRAEVEALQIKAASLASQLQLSLRVAPMGKLVSLARESNDRETRWAESVAFRSGAASIEGGEALLRAQRIESLKQQIVDEEARINELTRETSSSSTKSGPPSFDSLWGQGGE